jgi:hypothetical protein
MFTAIYSAAPRPFMSSGERRAGSASLFPAEGFYRTAKMDILVASVISRSVAIGQTVVSQSRPHANPSIRQPS